MVVCTLGSSTAASTPVQTEYAVKDLNEDPKLPYEDNSFDVITNAGGLLRLMGVVIVANGFSTAPPE